MSMSHQSCKYTNIKENSDSLYITCDATNNARDAKCILADKSVTGKEMLDSITVGQNILINAITSTDISNMSANCIPVASQVDHFKKSHFVADAVLECSVTETGHKIIVDDVTVITETHDMSDDSEFVSETVYEENMPVDMTIPKNVCTNNMDVSLSTYVPQKICEDTKVSVNIRNSNNLESSFTVLNKSDLSLNDKIPDSIAKNHQNSKQIDNMNGSKSCIDKKREKKCPDIITFTTLLKMKELDKMEAVQWFLDVGLITSEYYCPCGKKMQLKPRRDTQDGVTWRCRVGPNRHLVNRGVRAGSVFSESKMSMIEIMIFIQLWVYKIPTNWIYLEISISDHAVMFWSDICRNICLEACATDQTKIGGEDKVIVIDGAHWEKKKFSSVSRAWVFMGIEEIYSKKYFFTVVEKCNKQTFMKVVESLVHPGTTIVSKFCEAYNCFEDEDFIYFEEKYGFKFDYLKNNVNLKIKTWEHYKRYMAKHKHVTGFDNHFAEYAWRKKYCSGPDKMKKFVEAIKIAYPPRSRDLPKKVKN